MRVLGVAAASGIEPSMLLRAGPIEREILLAALVEAQEHQKRYIQALARQIIHELADAMKRGR